MCSTSCAVSLASVAAMPQAENAMWSITPGMAEPGHTHEARDDAPVDAVIIGEHRAIAGDGSADAGIGGGQRIGGARGRRQATIENEILMHELDGVSWRDDVVALSVDHAL